MRGRLLANEAALADYEILEMLLFLGIPRRDTKPLAKSLINRFGTLAALLLNSRNQLLAEPTWPGIPDPAGFPRAMLRHALEQHASAVLLVRHGSGRPRLTQADRTLFAAVQDAAGPLTVTLHDLVVTGQGGWTSLRQSGLC
jgi:DNA repair protein RadC